MFGFSLSAVAALASATGQSYGTRQPSTPATPSSVPPVNAQQRQGNAAAAPARSLKSIPNVTITYYDVTGKNGPAIAKSIAKNAPRAPGSKEAPAGTTNWTMKAEYTQRTTNGKCSVASAKAVFQGTATLPRLTTEATVNRELQEQWRTFLAGLESAAAADLGYAYDHSGDVEKAILGASCENAGKAGSDAIARLRLEAAEHQRAVVAATKTGQPKDRSRRGNDPVVPEEY